MRGIDNRVYYLRDPGNRVEYINDSGVGNTLNGYHTIVRRLIMDSLRYWVQYMHVDGFRFDLASVLSRGEDNQPIKDLPILWDIDSDPVLAGTRIIAEARDTAGLYQVGSFIGDRWSVWNGRYRDTVRRFVKSDVGMVRDLADAVSGSFKEFAQLDHDPMRSINFITAHDGFTLNDVVSYNDKHNQANGEHNLDGSDQNNSWNCGAEGPTDDLQGETLRMQQVCNFFTILLLSQGRPMFLLGDEVRCTQQDNNNAYSQDNEISWFDWNQVEAQRGLLRFVRGLLKFRQISGLFRDRSYWFEHAGTDIIWHGVRLGQPDWGENSHCLAFELVHPEIEKHLYVLMSAYCEPLEFELPNMGNGSRWARLVDTSKPAPEDFCDPVEPLPDGMRSFPARERAAVVLVEQRFNNNNQAV